MFWRVLEFCESQVTEKTVVPSIIICSTPQRGSTLDWMTSEMERILSKL